MTSTDEQTAGSLREYRKRQNADLRELKALGARKANLKQAGASATELAGIDEEIAVARAERAVRNALSSVPVSHRRRIVARAASELDLSA